MRFSAAAVLAFAASTLAQTPDFDAINIPKKDEVVTAGSSLTITWDAPAKYDSGTVSIELIGGATQNTQQHIANIASGVSNGAKTYTWKIDASLGGQNVYGLVFKLESDPKIFQYSNPFHIKGSGSKAATSSDVNTMTTSLVRSSTTTSTPASTTAAPFSSRLELMSNFVTSIEELTTTVPCTTYPANSTGSQSAPADSSAPTASNPIMTSTSTHGPVPTSGAESIRIGSVGILAVAAAYLLL